MSGRLQRLLRMSPLQVARLLLRRAQDASISATRRRADMLASTYSATIPSGLQSPLFGIPRVAGSPHDSDACARYCRHEFDLLGSGWTAVRYGMSCTGLEGIVFKPVVPVIERTTLPSLAPLVNDSNRTEATRLWSLLPADYVPIDWQLDFKSGFRWDARTWYGDIKFGDVRGADVKVPWELSRLQHLPQLALEYGRNSHESLSSEFRNQVIDWIAANPPRYGVNWYSTMDVAIRAANLLVAHDLFVAFGASFDEEFSQVFQRSIREHAVHIVENLEWSEALRANHYLANIAGLAFCAAYLPASSESSAWLAFAASQLQSCVKEQFHGDGSNFEASTSYHRLSSEMVVFASALLLGSSKRLPSSIISGLEKMRPAIERMRGFAEAVAKPDGNAWQLGDNDSGRFFKFAPVYVPHTDVLVENHLAHQHLLHAIAAFLWSDIPREGPDAAVVNELLGQAGERRTLRPDVVHRTDVVVGALSISTPPDFVQTRSIDLPAGILNDITHHAFPEFGVFLYKGNDFFLGIRAGSIGQNGIGGHAHCDQLSIELNVAGEDWIADPGSYVYTPLPERRNEYRAASAHSGPMATNFEQAELADGLFRLSDAVEARCLAFDKNRFVGEMKKGHKILRREVVLADEKIVVTDSSWGSELIRNSSSSVPFSAGYGLREAVVQE